MGLPGRQLAGGGLDRRRDPDQILAGLAALAERLGQRRLDDDTPTAAARAKAWLAATARPALLVFDNATDVAAVRAWCPATGAIRVVITSRNRAFLRAYEPVQVEMFTPAQAAALLHQRTGLDDPEGAADLAHELGHLPLALAQAAAMISRLPLDYHGYLEELRAFPVGDYLPAQYGDAYPAGTAEAILLSVTQAETALPSAQQLLETLAMLSPAGVPLTILHHWTGADTEPAAVRRLLADLADTSLITFSKDRQTVLMHRLIQRVLRERATHQGRLHTTLDQATALLHAFNTTLPDGSRTWAARAAVEMLIEQTDALYRQACLGDGVPADLLDLRAWCGLYLYDVADLARAIPLLKQTIVDYERVLGADHPHTLASRNNLAHAYQAARDLGRAIPLYEATLADCERVLGGAHPTTRVVRANLEVALSEVASRGAGG